MSPILVRPVREQLEHDRLIRFLLLNKYKRRYEAIGNAGEEHAAAVKIGSNTFFPDIVLAEGKKLAGLVEVETGESVNNLEALAQWVHFAKARVPFHLYVPVTSYDSARRLCELHHVRPAEVWTYRSAIDGFDLMRVQQNPVTGGSGRTATFERAEPKPPVVEKPEVKPEPPAKLSVPAKVVVKPTAAVKPVAAPPIKAAKPVEVAKPAKNGKDAKESKESKESKDSKERKPVKPAAKPAKAAKPQKASKAPKPKPKAKANNNKKKR